ncbi:temperature-induced lipocalin-1-like [Stylophora pistillata]|uniref:Apolipoprotein D n=1 Tax=Stylophora pistillata TaxID=50429 RepID=A0A2B4SAH5_STYPI|nr:temperature-induced lipocalin-1-like [Stylophora pistillata]PFX27674.1 Apolipoprotein D [Stylophora pistillata]
MNYTVFLVTVFFSCAFGIDTVPSLNVTKYLGRWYQVYADPAVMVFTERNAVCVTADYSLRKDGKIGVLNRQRDRTPTGKGKSITGYAYMTDPKEPGKLTLPLDGVHVLGSYWVVKLGPPTFGEEGLYQYSVVTDSMQIMLFVLTRDVETFRNQYDEEVKSFLAENGFTHFYNKPVVTLQDKKCLYGAEKLSPYQTVKEFLRYK